MMTLNYAEKSVIRLECDMTFTTVKVFPRFKKSIGARSTVGRKGRRDWIGIPFCLPYIVVFLFGTIIPLFYALYLGLYKQQMIGGSSFVGLANYVKALSDTLMWTSYGRVFLYFWIQTPLMLILSLVAALILDSQRIRHVAIPRMLLFLPYAVPGVIAAMMWGYIYGDDYGLVGQLFHVFGTQAPNLFSGRLMLFAIANIATWGFMGYNMLICYSALRVIPEELYESARIDGASEFRIAWSIKIPQIRDSLMMMLLFSLIGSFQLFNEPSILKTLAPETINSSYTPNIYTYSLAFTSQDANYAAAVSLVVGVITMVLVGIVKSIGDREGK